MEYVYAALLLHKAGKEVTEEGVKKVVEAAGIKADEAKIKALVSALDGVNIEEAISKASSAMVAVAAPAASGSAAPAEFKEEVKEEETGASATEGLSSLFG